MKTEVQQKRPVTLMLSIFSVALLLLLAVSHVMVLPILTQVQLGGVVYDVRGLAAKESGLKEKITNLELRRESLMKPVQNTVHASLVREHVNQIPFSEIEKAIRITADSFAEQGIGLVTIEKITYTPTSATIVGTVSNAADRTMTVVAQLSENLEILPQFTSIQATDFTRKKTADGDWYSPFSITLAL